MSIIEQTSSVTLHNIKVSMSEAGKGETILCFHGNPGSKSIFSDMMKSIKGLDLKLIALDRPGHNVSDEFINDQKDLWFDSSFYADFINAKLNKKVWLLGHDYGCLTAIKVAIKHPEVVNGLILLNPYLVPEKPNTSLSKVPDYSKGFLIGSILGISLPINYRPVFEQYLNDLFLPEKPSEDFVELWLPRLLRFENIIAYLSDNNILIQIQDELKEEMKKISVPTYALFGAKDGLTDIEKQRETVSLIPNAVLETSESNGHYMPHLNPDICVDFIKKAISNQNSSIK